MYTRFAKRQYTDITCALPNRDLESLEVREEDDGLPPKGYFSFPGEVLHRLGKLRKLDMHAQAFTAAPCELSHLRQLHTLKL